MIPELRLQRHPTGTYLAIACWPPHRARRTGRESGSERGPHGTPACGAWVPIVTAAYGDGSTPRIKLRAALARPYMCSDEKAIRPDGPAVAQFLAWSSFMPSAWTKDLNHGWARTIRPRWLLLPRSRRSSPRRCWPTSRANEAIE